MINGRRIDIAETFGIQNIFMVNVVCKLRLSMIALTP